MEGRPVPARPDAPLCGRLVAVVACGPPGISPSRTFVSPGAAVGAHRRRLLEEAPVPRGKWRADPRWPGSRAAPSAV